MGPQDAGVRLGRSGEGEDGVTIRLILRSPQTRACGCPLRVLDRGRDASYLAPPAQNRTGPIRAYGSHLGCMTALRGILATCRMRSSACDTISRLCVRPVLCWFAFPLVSALGSTGSAADRSALFVGFAATLAESDSPCPCIIGCGSSPSRCGPDRQRACGRTWGLPVPAQGASAHASVFDHAGSPKCLRYRSWRYCLPLHRQRRHPESVFYRGSMVGLCAPLPTLRRHPRGCLRTARGRRGSLLLHRSGLAPPTPCRSPGAPV